MFFQAAGPSPTVHLATPLSSKPEGPRSLAIFRQRLGAFPPLLHQGHRGILQPCCSRCNPGADLLIGAALQLLAEHSSDPSFVSVAKGDTLLTLMI